MDVVQIWYERRQSSFSETRKPEHHHHPHHSQLQQEDLSPHQAGIPSRCWQTKLLQLTKLKPSLHHCLEWRRGDRPPKTCHASRLRRLFVVKTWHRRHEPTLSITWRVCFSPRQIAHTSCGSLLKIRFPQWLTWGSDSAPIQNRSLFLPHSSSSRKSRQHELVLMDTFCSRARTVEEVRAQRLTKPWSSEESGKDTLSEA